VTPHRVRGSVLVAAALAALASRAPAQAPDRPVLILSMGAGYVTGGSIWRLDRQYAYAGVSSGALDSLTLSRRFRPGFTVGVGATLFRSPRFASTLEISFLGLTTESRCASLGPVASPYSFDSQHIIQQACEDIQGKSIPTSAAAFQLGGTWRIVTHGLVQPYVRLVGGVAILGGSFIETGGRVFLQEEQARARVFLADQNRRETTLLATLAAGVTLETAPGYQLRFEVRDIMTRVPTVTGPGDHTQIDPFAQVGSRTVHLLALTVALDLVLERQRTRRY
jgi:hypothetical protein